MNVPVREFEVGGSPDTNRAAPAAKMKFTYASGSRPLEGYTIKRGVGRGGFGEVYFATSDAGKEVALKLIRRNLDVELRGVTQCLNLKHPNLIALYDIRADEMGDQWVVMEYVSGESLEEVIERNPAGMPVEEALWWIRGICAGVAYLHDHGIVHRDLKPGNIFSDEDTVKIGDYGLAKFISCSRRSGQTESVGTVHYMAPEIANGRYGREIDTYALGIILFEMLTGRVPFEGESVGEVLMKHLTAEPDLSALDEPYRNIVQRALAKDPELRLNTVAEMVALLPGGEGTPPPATPAQVRTHATEFDGGPAEDAIAMARDRLRYAGQLGGKTDERTGRSSGTEAEEPIWKAIRETFSGDRFREMHPVQKGVLIFALVALFMWNADWIFSAIVPMLICYIIYRAIWQSWAQPTPQKGAALAADQAAMQTAKADQRTVAWSATPDPAAVAAERARTAERRRRARLTWRDRAEREIAAKPMREKVSELLGSMLLAAIFASIAAFVAPLVLAQQPGSERIATYLWLATAGTLGSWAILVPSKFYEGRLEDQVPMRIALMSLGAIVGLVAWLVGDILILHSPAWGEPVDVGHGLLSHEVLGWPASSENANPSLAVYLAYFAFLFLLPRWWRQTEFTRSSRLSVWWVFVAVGWAWLLHVFWWFPQPLGVMAAGVIAIATQLASPWMPPSRRRALAAEIEGGIV